MAEEYKGQYPPQVTLTPPADGRVLLHSCCAPCSSAVLEAIVRNAIPVTVFFSNSNIAPQQEYELRKSELVRYCESLEVEYFDDDYSHEDWLECVARGKEREPERGSRCQQCFLYRLRRAANYAHANGFRVLTTTLASSRWKSIEMVEKAGMEACAPYSELHWWGMNWRKGGLQPRRNFLVKELGFYNQNWCGCEFSHRSDDFLPHSQD